MARLACMPKNSKCAWIYKENTDSQHNMVLEDTYFTVWLASLKVVSYMTFGVAKEGNLFLYECFSIFLDKTGLLRAYKCSILKYKTRH